MKIKSLIILLSLFSATSCVPAIIMGGAGVLGYSASQERGIGGAISDKAIETKLDALFLTSKYKELFTNVSVNSVEGRVLLAGNVPSREARIQAENIAWSLSSVKEVLNQIKVVDKYQFSTKDLAKDSWISTQVESRLLFSKNISSSNYSVETVDGVVYLLGVAKDKSELQAVASTAAQVPGVKKVVSYIRLKDQQIQMKNPLKKSGIISDEDAYDSVTYQQVEEVNVRKPSLTDAPQQSNSNNSNNPYEVIEDDMPTLPGSIRMGDR
ncbi:MAG: BON domain-containing protein [Rickettsiales bacterium]|nr:BON domain-containing protein [Rickettsiales bacterium]